MARYGGSVYGAALYGASPLLSLSVEPMSINALDFQKVDVFWKSPIGDFTKIRLVRNQNSFPEHAEDGVIVFEENATQGTVSRSSLIDGEDNPDSLPITPGRQIYYRMFLFTSAKVWVTAGSITDVMPKSHDSQSKILDIIPKVFTTDEQSPLGIVNPDFALANFLSGFSLTYDQFLTLVDLLKPHHSNEEMPFALIPNEASTLGLNNEKNIPVKNQKALIREALYMYQHKGTFNGLNTYVEALTGWAPTTTTSDNLLLGPQDSTFYQTTGHWVATGGTITSDSSQTPAVVTNSIDNKYSCKIVASGAGSITLGKDNPLLKGVPVMPSTDYTLSFQVKKTSGSGTVTPSVTFYDFKQTELTTTAGTSVTTTSSWQNPSKTVTSDATASYAGISFAWSAAGTYFIDMVCLQEGDTASYDEARAITTFVAPNKTNLVPNPSFEVNVTDSWTKTGSVTVTQDTDVSPEAYTGSNSAKLLATDAWTFSTPAMSVDTGSYYTGSAFVKSTAGLTMSLIGRDSGGNIITTHTYDPITTSSWTRIYLNFVVGYNQTITTYEIKFSGAAGTYHLDCVQFEKGGLPQYGPVTNNDGSTTYGVVGLTPTEYFDGNLPSTFGAIWQGTANNSPTSVYFGKDIKMTRLTQTFDEWMVPNLFWRITSYAGVEATSPIV